MKDLLSIDSVTSKKIRTWDENNGSLGFIEEETDIPFNFKRVFYIYDAKSGEIRGKHAHRRCNQFLICLHGEIEVCCDDGNNNKKYLLNSPRNGLHIPPTIWAYQRYTCNESILMVLADRKFEEGDYIRDYNSFIEFRRGTV